MTAHSAGLHHITSISSDPRRTVGFYAGALGLRLVKRTVNFDDPGTYHLYFGDEAGAPGTIMTFFPWMNIGPGRHGTGQAEEVGFAVPRGSIGWWIGRLTERGIRHEGPMERFGDSVLSFKDSDGHLIEIVGTDWAGGLAGWDNGDVPAEHAIRGFATVILWLAQAQPTAEVMTGVLGFTEAGKERRRRRFTAGENRPGTTIELREVGDYPAGGLGAGIVHHIAFRAADDAAQAEMAARAKPLARSITPQIDRQYFRSVYFREPGGVLFEIATDDPGFAVDEAPAELGTALKLPPKFEPERARIEAALPPLGPWPPE